MSQSSDRSLSIQISELIIIRLTLSYVENEIISNVTAFPNPTDGIITLSLGDTFNIVDVTIFNTLGQEIFTNRFQQTQNITLQLPKATGLYYCKLTAEGMQKTIKLIKK